MLLGVRDRATYVFVGDSGFPLMNHVITPFKENETQQRQATYNRRQARARSTVERAFGYLTARFRILRNHMALSPNKATRITLACCYLHNFLGKTLNTMEGPLNVKVPIQSNAVDTRNIFVDYFNGPNQIIFDGSDHISVTKQTALLKTNKISKLS